MASDGDLRGHIKTFITLHSTLIDLDYEEEKRVFKYDTTKPDVALLERKGVLIDNLSIHDIKSEFGSCIVEFNKPSKSGSPISVTSGDVTSVWVHDMDRNVCLATGTVMQVRGMIKISFDNSNPFHWDQEKIYFILKTLSEVTYKRLRSALQNIYHHRDGRCSNIVKHMFGFTPLERSSLHPDFFNEDGEIKFFNSHLHSAQKEAVQFCLEQKNFAVVHGPPGTGKTTTLVEIILQLVNAGQKILLCAPSNIAVDTILEKLSEIKSKIIRVGKTARMLESSKNFSLGAAMSLRDDAPILKDVKNELEQRQQELKEADRSSAFFLRHEIHVLKKELYFRQYRALQELLRNASVVLTTLTSASDDGDIRNVPDEHFDVVIIDECSQAIEASCWIVIPRAPKVILAGDHLQLPPTIKSKCAYETGLGISLMERAITRMGEGCYKLLTHQFRMNASIMKWVSSFYENKLVADDSVANRLLKDLPGVKETNETGTPLMLVDTAFCSYDEKEVRGSKCNEGEADVVGVIVKRLIEAGVEENYISVITPYTLQVSCINTKISNLSNVEVRTVDGFQGREKEAVIISFVRSNRNKDLGFVADKRRLNVAVSRAQYFLAVVGDSETVRNDDTIGSLWKHIQDNGICFTANQFFKDVEELNFPAFMPEATKAQKCNPKTPKGSRASALRKKKQEESGFVTSKQSNSRSLRNSGKHQGDIDTQNLVKAFAGLDCTTQERQQDMKNNVQKHGEFDEAFSNFDCTSSHDHENTLRDEEAEISDVGPNGKVKITKEKKIGSILDKKTANIRKSDNIDKDLQAIEESLLKNTTCNMQICNASTNLYPQLCEHCRETFCLSHMLPEVHGCGDAAKRAARHNFRHNFRQQKQHQQQQKQSGERDKKLASIKLKKKVAEMAAERKPQKKK